VQGGLCDGEMREIGKEAAGESPAAASGASDFEEARQDQEDATKNRLGSCARRRRRVWDCAGPRWGPGETHPDLVEDASGAVVGLGRRGLQQQGQAGGGGPGPRHQQQQHHRQHGARSTLFSSGSGWLTGWLRQAD